MTDYPPINCPACGLNKWHLKKDRIGVFNLLNIQCSGCKYTVTSQFNSKVRHLLDSFGCKSSWLNGGELILCPIDGSTTWKLYNWDGDYIQVECPNGCQCNNCTTSESKVEIILKLIEDDKPIV